MRPVYTRPKYAFTICDAAIPASWAPRPLLTNTAPAIFGRSYGAQNVNQPWVGGLPVTGSLTAPYSDVPVLPAIGSSLISAVQDVPLYRVPYGVRPSTIMPARHPCRTSAMCSGSTGI